ncbi:MAG: sugar kinase [Nitrospirae bacterium CG_4_9_14_3_um_filter_53_35]|nr:MAG: sugar kinase [Nitrospirae bacterium CG17_big_fil_post_rev_8_21_14_2_50_50_9]PIX86755.1 MAG: sugar kinase [Nitrospirae bacterium CG_4_10_14_3_um_filter_53_41]PJA74209.1 MAG: sugar kinase [Nitrospirae bacterium CG_4_9_14_3_um_filter_53_35]
MSLLVVGSIAFDSVKTPFGKVEEAIGGSAVYFSLSAGFFNDINLVAVVGKDFPEHEIAFLNTRNVDTQGLQRVDGKTFRWKGEYSFELNEAHTLETHLNVFENFTPEIPDSYRDAEYVFLANIDPELQWSVLQQVKSPDFVGMDTMNFWIGRKREALMEVLKKVNILTINDGEARQLTEEANLVKAARKILSYGPKILIIKRGEYGALMFNGASIFSAPAYPLETVFDPTGAGDSFAGGFMGYLSNVQNVNEETLRRAMIFGSVMASFNVEDFSINRLRSLKYKEIEQRFRMFKDLTHFEDI